MTKITFYKKNDVIIGFEVSGHAGKNRKDGTDLLCCQLSTVAQLAVVGIDQIAKIKNRHTIEDGYLKIEVELNDARSEKVKFLFDTCMDSFKSIILDEEKYAKLEVKNV
ncbi:MAG: ribosomal-processing cysteine protease Prp [Clostridia bacterium]|nr:ribosomal-processing cysteine protease Prp [Clostridia bacterium]